MTAIGNTGAVYVASVLMQYADLPDTPLRPSLTDQSLARKLHRMPCPCRWWSRLCCSPHYGGLPGRRSFRRFRGSAPWLTSCR